MNPLVMTGAVYFARGVMVLSLTLPAAAGALAGGTLGSRIGRTRGASLVRPLCIGLGLILSAKLIFGK